MKLITRGFGGGTSSIITRGFLDIFTPTFDEIVIHFTSFRKRTVDFVINNRLTDFVLLTRESIFEISKSMIDFSINKATIVFGWTKRYIDFLFRT